MEFLERILPAIRFAARKHGVQRYGPDPYIVHLSYVAEVLDRFGHGPEREGVELTVAAFLHDVLEDTDATRAEITSRFGQQVCFLVDAVTDISIQGATRGDRKTAACERIRHAGRLAVILKVADRIANVEACRAYRNDGKNEMYKSEHLPFCAALYRVGECEAMWRHLDGLFGQRANLHKGEHCGC